MWTFRLFENLDFVIFFSLYIRKLRKKIFQPSGFFAFKEKSGPLLPPSTEPILEIVEGVATIKNVAAKDLVENNGLMAMNNKFM